jgi:hypothetical protein
MNWRVAIVVIIFVSGVQAQAPQRETDVRLNVEVSATGNLTSDGKGEYRTGEDFVAAWINPTRWPDMAFDICMNWPFDRYPGVASGSLAPARGTHDNRTLLHHLTDPVDPNAKPLGVFTGPGGGNDIALPKPLTATVATLTDMEVGTSLSPRSAEVRFCTPHCAENYSVIFGEKSVFGYSGVNGTGTTTPVVTRLSADSWRIVFPPPTVGRLWNRTPGAARSPQTQEDLTDLGLYYYRGTLDLRRQ